MNKSNNQFNVKQVLKDFDVKTEEDLRQTLIEESMWLPCNCGCGQEFQWNDMNYLCGQMYYKDHCDINHSGYIINSEEDMDDVEWSDIYDD
jgi:hypothetical protein